MDNNKFFGANSHNEDANRDNTPDINKENNLNNDNVSHNFINNEENIDKNLDSNLFESNLSNQNDNEDISNYQSDEISSVNKQDSNFYQNSTQQYNQNHNPNYNNFENNGDFNNTYYYPPLDYKAQKKRLDEERARLKAQQKAARKLRKEQERKRKKQEKQYSKIGARKLLLAGLAGTIIGGIISSLATLAFYSYGTKRFGDNFLGIVDDSPRKIVEKVSIVNEYDNSITAIADKVLPAVVGIRVTTQTPSSIFGSQKQTGEGSGIIYRDDGYIVTNFHVIQNAIQANGKMRPNSSIEVVLASDTNKLYDAEVIGYDWMTDLAVIKINQKNLPVVDVANSDEIKVGDLAVAVGNPGGFDFLGSVSVGVISGLNRTIALENSANMTLIQTDAAINPGNSGGALVNYLGELVGVNSAKLVSTDYEGMGFAIPSNTVVKVCNDLIENKYVRGRPFIGITADLNFNAEIAHQLGVPEGVLVDSVISASPAYIAGINRGDIIIEFNGVRIKTFEELNAEKNKFQPGDTVSVKVYRNGEELTMQLKLTEANG